MMEIEDLLEVTTQAELLTWLAQNYKTEKVCWVTVSIKPEPNKLQYLDAVEAALCFGWVDSTKKKLSDTQTVQRLSPRSKKSNWTELNKERVRRLERLNLMTDAGRAVLPNMDISSFLIDSEIKDRIENEPVLVEKFTELPELYTRICIDTIQSVRDDRETYEKRLNKFLESLREGKIIGQWHDNGRLWPID
ncbi:YdeI/OmpD-associated family protein [Weissella ceti]|nr:YdeI/OmpD-associated family protein [Weissella ceti]